MFAFAVGTHPLMPARLERPTPPTPGTAVPAPGPSPARVIGAERELRVGTRVLHVIPGPSAAERGEWSDALQPALFRAYMTPAPRE